MAEYKASEAKEQAYDAARKLFKELSDSYSMSGCVCGRSRDLVPAFAAALSLSFEKGVCEGVRLANSEKNAKPEKQDA